MAYHTDWSCNFLTEFREVGIIVMGSPIVTPWNNLLLVIVLQSVEKASQKDSTTKKCSICRQGSEWLPTMSPGFIKTTKSSKGKDRMHFDPRIQQQCGQWYHHAVRRDNWIARRKTYSGSTGQQQHNHGSRGIWYNSSAKNLQRSLIFLASQGTSPRLQSDWSRIWSTSVKLCRMSLKSVANVKILSETLSNLEMFFTSGTWSKGKDKKGRKETHIG